MRKYSRRNKTRAYESRGISIDPETLRLALARAEELELGWSEYVRRCIKADIVRGGTMKLYPRNKDPDADSSGGNPDA